jgi:hypothetical protein
MRRVTLQWVPPYQLRGACVDDLLEGVKAEYVASEFFQTGRLEETVDAILRYGDRIVWRPHIVELVLRDEEVEWYPALRRWTAT